MAHKKKTVKRPIKKSNKIKIRKGEKKQKAASRY